MPETFFPVPPRLPDYELLRRIGGGSYGEVWLGRGVTGMFRAVKIVRRDKFDNPRPYLRELEGITRFQKSAFGKARQLALLHVGANESEGFFYYVMELADDAERGSEIDPDRYVALTLKERLQRTGRVGAQDCLRLAVELTQALAELHGLGLIHRDIKPSNLIFVNGQPKIADVGLVSSVEVTLTSVGTPGYEAPEGPGTQSADLYSLGKVIYVAATGMAAGEFPRLPPELKDWADSRLVLELNEVLTRACAHDPADRYADASALLDDLLLIQAGRSLTELTRLKRAVRRVVRLGAVAAVAGLVVMAFLWQRSTAARRLAEQANTARQEVEAQARQTRAALYAAQLGRAQLALQLGDLGLARAALGAAGGTNGAGEASGFEWRVLSQQASGEAVATYITTSGAALAGLAISDDGRRFATVGPDRVARVWDAGRSVPVLSVTNVLRLGGFSADGTRLSVSTTARQFGWIQVVDGQSTGWAPLTGSILGTVGGGARVLVLSPPGEPDEFRVWDLETGGAVTRVVTGSGQPARQVSAAAASPDGRWLAVSVFDDRGPHPSAALEVWRLDQGRIVANFPDLERVGSLRISSNGQALAVGMAGKGIRVYRSGADGFPTEQGRMELVGHQGQVDALAFSPDGRQLASAGEDQFIHIWDLADGREVRRLRGHAGRVRGLEWTRGGAQLVSASVDGSLRVWDLSRPAPVDLLTQLWTDALGGCRLTSDGSRAVLTDANGDLAVFNLASGQRERTFPGGFMPLKWSRDGTQLSSLGTNWILQRWEVAGGGATSLGAAVVTGGSAPLTLATDPLGARVAYGFREGNVTVQDVDTGAVVTRVSLGTNEVHSVAISADRTWLATGTGNGQVQLWKLPEGVAAGELSTDGERVTALVFSPDGRWLVASRRDGRSEVFDTARRERIASLGGHSGRILAAAFSSDGRRLVTGGNEGIAVVWSVPDWRQLASLVVPRGGVTAQDAGIAQLEFGPDDSVLVAFTEDGRLQVWRAGR